MQNTDIKQRIFAIWKHHWNVHSLFYGNLFLCWKTRVQFKKFLHEHHNEIWCSFTLIHRHVIKEYFISMNNNNLQNCNDKCWKLATFKAWMKLVKSLNKNKSIRWSLMVSKADKIFYNKHSCSVNIYQRMKK